MARILVPFAINSGINVVQKPWRAFVRERRPPRLAIRLAVWLWLAACAALPDLTHADDSQTIPKVTYDFETQVFDETLPHGVAFYLEVKLPDSLPRAVVVEAALWPSNGKQCANRLPKSERNLASKRGVRAGPPVVAIFKVETLEYSTKYCFAVYAKTGLSTHELAAAKDAVKKVALHVMEHGAEPGAIESWLAEALGSLASLKVTDGSSPTQTLAGELAGVAEPSLAELASAASELKTARSNLVRASADLSGTTPGSAVLGAGAELAAYQKSRKAFDADILRKGVTSQITAEGAVPSDVGFVEMETQATSVFEAAQVLLTAAQCAVALDAQAKFAHREQDVKNLTDVARRDQELKALQDEADATRPKVEACNGIFAAAQLANSIRLSAAAIKQNLDHREHALRSVDAATNGVDIERILSGMQISADSTYTERAPFYFAADLGVTMPIYGKGAGVDAALYVAIAMYFQAVDKDIALSVDGSIGRRLALLFGFTLTNVKDSANSISGVLNDKTVLAGLGYRVTDYLRLGAGGMLFRQKSGNPTIDSTSVRVAPFLSASIDIDVVGTIKGLFNKGTAAAH